MLSPIIPIGLLAFKMKKESGFNSWALMSFLLITLFVDVLNIILAYYGIHNIFLDHLYTVLISVPIALLFVSVIRGKKNRSGIKIITPIFILFAIIYFFAVDGFNESNTLPHVVLSVSVVYLCLVYYYREFQIMIHKDILQIPFFWVNGALLFYFGTTLFISIFGDYIIKRDLELYSYTWPVYLYASIVMAIILSIGIWKIARK